MNSVRLAHQTFFVAADGREYNNPASDPGAVAKVRSAGQIPAPIEHPDYPGVPCFLAPRREDSEITGWPSGPGHHVVAAQVCQTAQALGLRSHGVIWSPGFLIAHPGRPGEKAAPSLQLWADISTLPE